MNKKKVLCILPLFILVNFLFGQSFNSVASISDAELVKYRTVEILSDSTILTYLHFSDGSTVSRFVNLFEPNGEEIKNLRISANILDADINSSGGFASNDSLFSFTFSSIASDFLVGCNFQSEEAWAKELIPQDASVHISDSKTTGLLGGKIITTRATFIEFIDDFSSGFALACFDNKGNALWDFAYGLPEKAIVSRIQGLPDGSIAITGWYDKQDRSFFIKLSELGVPITSYLFGPVAVNEIHEGADGFYYSGGLIIPALSNNNPNSSLGLIKMNQDFEIIWTKEIGLAGLNGISVDYFVKQNGNIVISYSGFGDLPVVVAEITPSNEILWERGYPFSKPKMKLLNDNSLLFFTNTKYLPSNQKETNHFVLAKTNPDGTFDDCETYQACISIREFNTTREDLEVTYMAIDSLQNVSATAEQVTWQFEDYCYTPPAPIPNFHHPDTICLNACPAPDSLENFYAHAQEWTITAPDGSDTLMLDKAPEYCFNQEGTYLIEQTIWFLGCDYSYEQTVEIVPAMNINLGNDGINCNALPYELTLQSNRPIMSYEWSDGSTNPTLMLTESGTYWVAARGPYCESVERDTITIEFIEDYVDLPLFTLPSDTSICIQHYPYTIAPQSSSPLSYTLNGATNAALSHAITQAGSYTFATTVEGCIFQDTINITTNDCQASIYLPNAFSPNFDGINDELFPQGIDFETISLEVFDRWGGLVAQSIGSMAAWDGRGASVGVYVIQLTYRNLLSNEVEVLVKDMVLIR